MSTSNRRDFIKAGAAVTATAASAGLLPVHAAGIEKIKVGVIGCGGRGSGAIGDSLKADKSVVFWAAGDVFGDKAKNTVNAYSQSHKDQVDVGDRIFGGLDAFQKVIDSGVDLVILATPPGFRPYHVEAAIKANKHVFCEKPVAVDGPGIRKCLEVAELAKKNQRAVVAGTQRRHQAGYIKTIEQIHAGAIGDIVSARCSWNGREPWFRARKQDQSDVEYQLNNWYHFNWLCGDHINEQHVHNLDVINWVMKGHPLKCVGQGGRIARKAGTVAETGNIYDLFCIEYEYAGGVPMYSYCSHVPNTTQDVSETIYGTKGSSRVNQYMIGKEKVHKGSRDEVSPYVQEHIDLIQSIKAGKPLNELQAVAESTLTAIMGRMAVYSGQVVTWEQALNSKEETMPTDLQIKGQLATAPIPVPGKYKVA
jgi:predicted dehydrogenase